MSEYAKTESDNYCTAGISSFIRWRADASDLIDSAIAADESAVLPKLVKAWMLTSGRDASFARTVSELMREIPQCLEASATVSTGSEQSLPGTDCQPALWSALQYAQAGSGVEAATELDEFLVQCPTNLLVHQLLQEELFWMGRADWMRDVTDRAAPFWSNTDDGYGNFLSLRAFAHEESGCLDKAEHYGRMAVEIDDEDIWGTHAVAHVLIMKGEMSRGIDWLESLSANWGHANQMRHHLWWHVCLFLLERGQFDRILELLTTEIRNPDSALVKASPAAAIDIENFASLLLRLELYGVDVGDRWADLATVCAGRVNNHGNAFANVHDMMVLAATGQFEKADQLLCSMRDTYRDKAGSVALAYTAAGIPACEAVLAHRRCDYKQVLRSLGSVRHDLPLMGASHAQRDVLYHMLVHAATESGRDTLRTIYLQDISRIGFCDVPERSAYRRQ